MTHIINLILLSFALACSDNKPSETQKPLAEESTNPKWQKKISELSTADIEKAKELLFNFTKERLKNMCLYNASIDFASRSECLDEARACNSPENAKLFADLEKDTNSSLDLLLKNCNNLAPSDLFAYVDALNNFFAQGAKLDCDHAKAIAKTTELDDLKTAHKPLRDKVKKYNKKIMEELEDLKKIARKFQ